MFCLYLQYISNSKISFSYVSVDSTTPGQDIVRDSDNTAIVVTVSYRLGVFGSFGSLCYLL